MLRHNGNQIYLPVNANITLEVFLISLKTEMLHFFAQESLNIKILCKVTQTGLSQGWLLYHWNCIFFYKVGRLNQCFDIFKKKTMTAFVEIHIVTLPCEITYNIYLFCCGRCPVKTFFSAKNYQKGNDNVSSWNLSCLRTV